MEPTVNSFINEKKESLDQHNLQSTLKLEPFIGSKWYEEPFHISFHFFLFFYSFLDINMIFFEHYYQTIFDF
jgi:hypothetical protein